MIKIHTELRMSPKQSGTKKNKSGKVAIPHLKTYWAVLMQEQEKET